MKANTVSLTIVKLITERFIISLGVLVEMGGQIGRSILEKSQIFYVLPK